MPKEGFGSTYQFLAKGDFAGLILVALQEKSMQGYEIIRPWRNASTDSTSPARRVPQMDLRHERFHLPRGLSCGVRHHRHRALVEVPQRIDRRRHDGSTAEMRQSSVPDSTFAGSGNFFRTDKSAAISFFASLVSFSAWPSNFASASFP